MIGQGRLAGKVAVISGGSRGLGRATGDLFAEEGATVFLCDINGPREPLKPNQYQRALDVTRREDWLRLAAEIEKEFGAADILVNNAGIVSYAGMLEVEPADWNRSMAVNVDGVLFGMQAFIPQMQKRKKGSIVNLSSIWGSYGAASAAAYQASKGAVRNMTKNAALTFVKDGIRVNSVHPGISATPHVLEEQPPSNIDAVVAKTPMGRMGEPREIAYGILFLAADESSYVTGIELYVDGGYTAQ